MHFCTLNPDVSDCAAMEQTSAKVFLGDDTVGIDGVAWSNRQLCTVNLFCMVLPFRENCAWLNQCSCLSGRRDVWCLSPGAHQLRILRFARGLCNDVEDRVLHKELV